MAGRTIVRRVRLTPDEDARLKRIAKARGADVSTVIRDAIGLIEQEGRRRAAYDELIAMAEREQKRLKGRRPRKIGGWLE